MTRLKRSLVLLPLAIFAFTFTAAISWAKNAARNQWHVRHKLTNNRHEEGTPLTLRIDGHAIQALDGKVVVLNIPADQVQAITYDDDVHRPVSEWLLNTSNVVARDTVRQALAENVRGDWTGIKAFSGAVCAGTGAAFCRYKDTNFMATLAGDVAMAAFLTILDKHQKFHSMDLVWLEDGVLRNALFHVDNQKEERPLLDALTNETGRQWIDLTERRRNLQDEIERFKLMAQPLLLDRPVLISAEKLAAGKYQVVAVTGDKDVQLNLFRGTSVAAETFVAQAIARRKTRESGAGDSASAPTAIRYTDGNPSEIAEIVIHDTTYSFSPAAAEVSSATTSTTAGAAAAPGMPVGESEVPVLTLKMKNGNTAQVSLVTYRGQRALRFPVEHVHTDYGLFAKHTLEECAGSLYVMADRVAFDAGLNLHKDRDPFDVERSEIKEARTIPRSAVSWGTIRIVVGKRTYDFMPYFSNTQSPLANPPGRGAGSAVGWVTGFRQLWNTGTVGRPMLDAFLDALLDFPGTITKVEGGHYTPKPHKEIKIEEPTEEPSEDGESVQ